MEGGSLLELRALSAIPVYEKAITLPDFHSQVTAKSTGFERGLVTVLSLDALPSTTLSKVKALPAYRMNSISCVEERWLKGFLA